MILASESIGSPFRLLDLNLDLLLWEMISTFSGGATQPASQSAACRRVWMLGSTGSTGTSKDSKPFSTSRQLTWSFIKESILGFDNELRSLESAHCGNPKPTFLFWCRIYNMSTWPHSLWLWSQDGKWFKQMWIPGSKITRVPQQYFFRMLLPSLYEPCLSSQRGWPMKPWDSARALQVCG